MNQNLTELVCVVDKSGSMGPLQNDAIGGFNSFLKDQKAQPGDARLTLVLFDTDYKVVYDGKPLQDVPELTHETYVPGGATALIDACCRAIDTVGKRLANTPEAQRPRKVMVLIITDGEENSSKEFTMEQLRSRVECQRGVYKWEFVFFGANIDAFAVGSAMGLSPDLCVNYVASADGTRKAYEHMSNLSSHYRSS